MTDGQTGHVSVNDTGNFFYIDPLYHGIYDVSYRGTYDAAGDVTLAGSGMFILDPLDYSGSWGGAGTIYYDNNGTKAVAATDSGLMGLVASATGYDFYAAGDYFMAPVAGISETAPFIFANTIGGEDRTGSGDELAGYTAGVWQYTTNAYGLPGDMDGALAALKVSSEGGVVTVERLSGDLRGEYFTQPINYEESDGVFRVRGDLEVESLTTAEDDLATIQGVLSGTGSGDLLAFLETSIDQVIGIYSFGLGNAGGDTTIDTLIGGTFDGDAGYFFADVTDSPDQASLAGRLQTLEYMVDLSGDVFDIATDGDTAGSGTWIAQSVGQVDNFTRFDLSTTWGGDAGTLYFNDGGAKSVAARESGILGFLATADGYDVYGVGEYGLDADFGGSESDPFVWDTVIGTDPATATLPTTVDPVVTGYTAGQWGSGSGGSMAIFNNSLDASVYTIERLQGSVTVDSFADLEFAGADGMWQVEGTLAADTLTVAENNLETIQGTFSGIGTGGLLAYLDKDPQAWLDPDKDPFIGIFTLGGGSSEVNTHMGGTFDGGADKGYFIGFQFSFVDAWPIGGLLQTSKYAVGFIGGGIPLFTEGAAAGDSTWINQSIGVVEEITRFDFSSTWGGPDATAGTLYFNDQGAKTMAALESGILGFVKTDIGYTVSSIGEYSLDAEFTSIGTESDPFIWDTVIGADPDDATDATEIMGYTAGLWQEKDPDEDGIVGAMALFNNTYDDRTGLYTIERLHGGLNGFNLYSDLDYIDGDNGQVDGMWVGQGLLTASPPQDIAASNLEMIVIEADPSLSGDFVGSGEIIGLGSLYAKSYVDADTDTGKGMGIFSLGFGNADSTKTVTGFPADGNVFSGKPAGDPAVAAVVGGQINYPTTLFAQVDTIPSDAGAGYFLAHVDGTMRDDGSINAALTKGSLLTRTFRADMTGSVFGQGDAGEAGTWIGQGVGTIDVENLAYVSGFNADIRRAYPGGEIEGHYDYTSGSIYPYPDGYFDYYYKPGDDYARITDRLPTITGDYGHYSSSVSDLSTIHYFADGRTFIEYQRTWDPDMNGIGYGGYVYTYDAYGDDWDPADGFDSLLPLENDPVLAYENIGGFGSEGVGILEGLLGGPQSLWDGNGLDIPLYLMGSYAKQDADASIWATEVYSEGTDPDVFHSTYKGGAYFAYIGGIDNNSDMEGLLAGLYIDPSGNAGVLRGDFSGDAYEDLGLFSMEGSIAREYQASLGIGPEILDSRLFTKPSDNMFFEEMCWPVLSGMTMTGNLGDNGSFSSVGLHEMGSGGFETTAIWGTDGWDLATDPNDPDLPDGADPYDWQTDGVASWGIYSATLYGAFDNPDLSTTWSAGLGGYGGFGAYLDPVSFSLPVVTLEDFTTDYGYWYAAVGVDETGVGKGEWVDDQFNGEFEGSFLTRTRMGNPDLFDGTGIAGDVLGTYNEETGTWEAFSAGTWAGVPLDLSGDWAHKGKGLHYIYKSGSSTDYTCAGKAVGSVGLVTSDNRFYFTGMGYYQMGGLGEYPETRLVWPEFRAFEVVDGAPNTEEHGSDGCGEFNLGYENDYLEGFAAGIWRGGNWDGEAVALFVDPDAKSASLLSTFFGAGSFDAEYQAMRVSECQYDPEIDRIGGMWMASGELVEVLKTDVETIAGYKDYSLADYYLFVKHGYLDSDGMVDTSGDLTIRSDYSSGKTSFVTQKIVDTDPDTEWEGGICETHISMPWGTYRLKLGGTYELDGDLPTKDDPIEWSALLGGQGVFGKSAGEGENLQQASRGGTSQNDENGYWFMSLSDGKWFVEDKERIGSISGDIYDDGTFSDGDIFSGDIYDEEDNPIPLAFYLTPSHIGTLTGQVSGLYLETVAGYGGWLAESVGYYTHQKALDFSAYWSIGEMVGEEGLLPNLFANGPGIMGTGDGDYGSAMPAGSMSGLLGGIGDPLDDSAPADFLAMGEYELYGGDPETTLLFRNNVIGFGGDIVDIFSAGLGAADESDEEFSLLLGFSTGLWSPGREDGLDGGTMDGALAALYFEGDLDEGVTVGLLANWEPLLANTAGDIDLDDMFTDYYQNFGDFYALDAGPGSNGMWMAQGDLDLFGTVYLDSGTVFNVDLLLGNISPIELMNYLALLAEEFDLPIDLGPEPPVGDIEDFDFPFARMVGSFDGDGHAEALGLGLKLSASDFESTDPGGVGTYVFGFGNLMGYTSEDGNSFKKPATFDPALVLGSEGEAYYTGAVGGVGVGAAIDLDIDVEPALSYHLFNVDAIWGPEDVNGSGEIFGMLTGEYLSTTEWGVMNGPLFGVYDVDAYGGGYSSGGWIANSVGTYQATPLNYYGGLAGLSWSADSGLFQPNPVITGLVGVHDIAEDELYNEGIKLMGAHAVNTPLWAMGVQGFMEDGGFFGSYLDFRSSGDALAGQGVGLYLSADGYGEFMTFSTTGTHYPGLGMWAASGGVVKEQAVLLGTPEGLFPIYDDIEFAGSYFGLDNNEIDVILSGSFIGEKAVFSVADLGIFRMFAYGGGYEGSGFESLEFDEDGYWLASAVGIYDDETEGGEYYGYAYGYYLSESEMGRFSGEIDSPDFIDWTVEQVEMHDLDFGGYAGYSGGCLQYNFEGEHSTDGYGYGGFGLVANPGNAIDGLIAENPISYDLIGLGEYEYDSVQDAYRYLWWPKIGTSVCDTGDGDIYGYTSSLWGDGEISHGKAVALYLGPDGQSAGLLAGDFTGNYYDTDLDGGRWLVDGAMDTIKTSTIRDPDPDLGDYVYWIKKGYMYASLSGHFNSPVGEGVPDTFYGMSFYNNVTNFLTEKIPDECDSEFESYPWGIYWLKLASDSGGYGDPDDFSDFYAVTGGRGVFDQVRGECTNTKSDFWIASVSGSWSNGLIDGSILNDPDDDEIFALYLTRDHFGTLSGNFLGLYDEFGWIAESAGYFEGDDLGFSTYWGYGGEGVVMRSFYGFDDSYGSETYVTAGHEAGILGGFFNTDGSAQLIALGEFAYTADGNADGSYQWFSSLTNGDYHGDTESVEGYTAGLWSGGTMAGGAAAILRGGSGADAAFYTSVDLAGHFYDTGYGGFSDEGFGGGLWKVDGTLQSGGFAAAIDTDSLPANFKFEQSGSYGDGLGLINISDLTFQNVGPDAISPLISAIDPTWWMQLQTLDGTSEGYSGSGDWSLFAEYGATIDHDSDSGAVAPEIDTGFTTYAVMNNGAGWNNDGDDQITADLSGAWINWDTAMTGVSGGELTGLFNPGANNWKAVAAWTYMDTETFLASIANNPQALVDMNIPSWQVGQAANMSGDGNNLYVEINGVTFFAHSSNMAPSIWAAGDVSGTFSAAPTINTGVLVSGDGLSASFVPKSWGTMTNDHWTANVNGGSGSVGNYTVDFNGAAAGTIVSPIIPPAGDGSQTDGDFGGTAAGVVTNAQPLSQD
jgi:hypothetical protein